MRLLVLLRSVPMWRIRKFFKDMGCGWYGDMKYPETTKTSIPDTKVSKHGDFNGITLARSVCSLSRTGWKYGQKSHGKLPDLHGFPQNQNGHIKPSKCLLSRASFRWREGAKTSRYSNDNFRRKHKKRIATWNVCFYIIELEKYSC